MKNIFFGVLLLSSFAFSQTVKKVGDFDKVTVFDKIKVTLVPAKESKVVLSGTNSQIVEVVNKNGELKIRMPLTQLLKGSSIEATVYYTRLEAVEANEGSSITSKAIFKTTAFDLIAKEGAQIDIHLEVAKFKAKVSSGAIVECQGSAKNQDVAVNTGATYDGSDLKTIQTSINVNAGGEAQVYASEFVDAKVRAGGNILIYGNPNQVNQKTIAGGHITLK